MGGLWDDSGGVYMGGACGETRGGGGTVVLIHHIQRMHEPKDTLTNIYIYICTNNPLSNQTTVVRPPERPDPAALRPEQAGHLRRAQAGHRGPQALRLQGVWTRGLKDGRMDG